MSDPPYMQHGNIRYINKDIFFGFFSILSSVALFSLILIGIPYIICQHKSKLGRRNLHKISNHMCTISKPCEFWIVADLDLDSKVNSSKLSYRSYLKKGYLKGFSTATRNQRYIIDWSDELEIRSQLNEGGRGMELSDLVYWDGRLLAPDDRTGIIFEIFPHENKVSPKYIISEGDGSSDKGMKIEWMLTKDNDLWLGSLGREFIDPNGKKIDSNFWVTQIKSSGQLIRHDWTHVYNKIQETLGVPYPGYCNHEAVRWSIYLKRWVFLPRRVSSEPFSDEEDSIKGANSMLFVEDELINSHSAHVPDVVQVKELIDPSRGFSAFDFIPGTDDRIILAIKSQEGGASNGQMTYSTIFNIYGDILMNETLISDRYKFEGLVFLPT
eukprot:GHVL01010155.1.p1 GENE.GHVL01010155.1~~GHVL01010155.1.p1  ORF type:complete len:383 (-),score=60.74 GHVL01010155.1:280-1428(-)